MTDYTGALQDMNAAIASAPQQDNEPVPVEGNPFAAVLSDIANARPADLKPPSTQWSGSFFPVSQDETGKYHFDPNVGVLAGIRSGLSAPADVVEGRLMTPYSTPRPPVSPGTMSSQVDPNTINRAIDFTAVSGSPISAARRAGEFMPMGLMGDFGAPTAQQLKTVAAKGYDAARASDMTVPGADIAGMANQLQQTLQGEHGVIAKTAPKTFAILDELAAPPAGAVGTYPGLEAARRGLSAISSEGGTDGFAAQKAVGALNKFIDEMAPEAADARANYAAAMRSNALTGELDRANTGILEQAQARAEATHSGQNLDNAIRQRVASLLQSPDRVGGFSQAEIDALKGVVAGGPVQNIARRGGNLLGGGQGMHGGALGTLGAVIGSHYGPEVAGAGAAAPILAGAGLKKLENALSVRQLNNADEIVRQNSPLYRAMQSEGALTTPAIGRNSAVLRAILPGLISPTQQTPYQPSLAQLLANGA